MMHTTINRITILLLTALAAVGCGGPGVAPEETDQLARQSLIPTYTPLPPATPTITPFPSATATAPPVTPTPDAFVAAGRPVRVEIPAIDVDAAVEHVGRLPNGQMDVPKIPENVAWFDESALPGQPGKPSVIAGHLDSPLGPAVFYELRRLRPEDELVVTYSSGERYVFVVEEKERYTVDQVPASKLFGPTNKRRLNLITCDGAWNSNAANYQQRLVVYTRLKES